MNVDEAHVPVGGLIDDNHHDEEHCSVINRIPDNSVVLFIHTHIIYPLNIALLYG